MKKKFSLKNNPTWLVVLGIVFYFAGCFFLPSTNIEHMKQLGIAEQEEYTYVDRDGEEHEGTTLIKIDGIGKLLTYSDIYLASTWTWLVAMFIGWIIFGSNGGETPSTEASLRHITFANSILGVLLIWITTKESIWATVFFWLGIISVLISLIISGDE